MAFSHSTCSLTFRPFNFKFIIYMGVYSRGLMKASRKKFVINPE